MFRYFLKRVAVLIPVVLIVSIFSFGLLYMAPSDPITMKYAKRGEMPPAEVIAQEKAALGLDKGFVEQYSAWLFKALKGDWGSSYNTNQPVAEIMRTKLPNTIVLTFSAVCIMLIFAYPLGILSAVYRNKWVDYAIRLFSFWGTAMPTFWLGLLLMYWFGVRLRLLPVMGSGDVKHLILPAVSLAVWLTALYCRRICSGIVAEINKDYVTGLKPAAVSQQGADVFQSPMSTFSPYMTIQTYLLESLRSFGGLEKDEREQAAALLAQVELSGNFLDRLPHQLSGGQLQRVVIARALALNPEVILLDEPTSALDILTQRAILELLARIAKERKMSLVFVGHNSSAVRLLTHRIYVMEAGRIIEEVPSETLLQDASEEYTRQFFPEYVKNVVNNF